MALFLKISSLKVLARYLTYMSQLLQVSKTWNYQTKLSLPTFH